MKLFAIVLFASIAASAVACSGADPTPTPGGVILTTPLPNPTATPEPVVTSENGVVQKFEVNLALNGSPQQGTAVFTRKNDFFDVEIKMRPGVRAQVAVLRRGKCPDATGFVHEMDLLIGGIMRQEVRDLSFDDLLKGNLTLVVSTNDRGFTTLAACGELPTAG